ncbi:MAG: hypothetical protein JWQ96_2787 [Segetibacter sp.]|nr:hypothetical protein [Segetibacter sp.]
MGHLNSHLLWHKYAKKYFTKGLKVLEIGPAGYPTYYETVLKAEELAIDYKVLDISANFISGAENNPNFILSEDPINYPFPDNTFDLVFSDQVLAHVEYFWLWYAELVRITKPEGFIITINSFSYPSCPSPIDAWRVHSDGMKVLNKFYGIKTIMSVTESLEIEKYGIKNKTGYYFPGASISNPYNYSPINLKINLLKRSWNNFVGRLPKLRSVLLNPVHVAFDTVTIAQIVSEATTDSE